MQVLRGCLALMWLVALGCGSAETGWVRVDPGLAALVPADTVTLGGVRMEALRATAVYKKWVAGKSMPLMDEFAKETGLDLRKDLAELLSASNGKDTMVLARGKFSPAALESRLSRPGVKRMPYRSHTLIGNEEGAVAFLNSTTAVAGRAAMIHSVIDQRNRGGVPAALLEKLKTVPASSQIWAVSLGGFGQIGKAVPQEGMLANVGKILSLIENFTFAADLRTGLDATAAGLCKSEQDARSLSDALRGLIGLGRLSTPDNEPEMLRFYDAIQVEQQQRTVRVRAQIPQDLLDKAIQKLEALGPAPFVRPGFPPRRPR